MRATLAACDEPFPIKLRLIVVLSGRKSVSAIRSSPGHYQGLIELDDDDTGAAVATITRTATTAATATAGIH